MGYGAINQGLTSRDSLKEQQAHLLELQTAVRVLEQDFVQLAPRPVRQAVGDEPAQPALQGGAARHAARSWRSRAPAGRIPRGCSARDCSASPTFSKTGHSDASTGTCSIRRSPAPTAKRELLTHVKTLAIRYMDVNRTWQEQWPPLTATVLDRAGHGADAAPAADRGRDHARHRGLGQDRAHHRDRRMSARRRARGTRRQRPSRARSAALRCWWRSCWWRSAPSSPRPWPTRTR